MTPILIINENQIPPQDLKFLHERGYEILWTEGDDVPAVQLVPSKADRRFTVACAALQGMFANSALMGVHAGNAKERAETALKAADALLTELDKPT